MVADAVFWVGALCLGLGALAILLLGSASSSRQAARTGLHGTVCLIAAAAYIILATGTREVEIGPLEIGTRYLDWLLTTPLLLVALTVTAAPFGRTIVPLVATIVFLDVVMILAGAVAADAVGVNVWVWFAVSSVAFAFVLGLLWVPVREVAESGHPIRTELFVRHAGILTCLWLIYPVVFFLGPDFQSLFGRTAQDVLFTVLDVASKAAYGLLVVLEDDRLVPLEEKELAAARARQRTEAERPADVESALREDGTPAVHPASSDAPVPPAPATDAPAEPATPRVFEAEPVAPGEPATPVEPVPATAAEPAPPANERVRQRRYAAARELAKRQLLDMYYRGGRAARTVGGAAQEGGRRVIVTAGRPLYLSRRTYRWKAPLKDVEADRAREAERARRARKFRRAEPPVEVDAPRRPDRSVIALVRRTPFGRLRKEDAAPALIVAAALLVVAQTARRRKD